MEPAGFAVGVVGLAGLFSSCLEAVNKVQSYHSARADADVQDTLFNAVKARFEQWGRGVGIVQGRLLNDHHPALDDKGISTAVRDLLHFITKFICDDGHASSRRSTQTAGLGDDLLGSNQSRARHGPSSEPRRRKLAWAFWGKGERTEQVNLFEKLVQELHNLVPPYSGQGTQWTHKLDAKLTDTHTDVSETSSSTSLSAELCLILARIEGESRAEARREIHSWLEQRLPNERYHDSLQTRLVGTCDWILFQTAFKEWLAPESVANAKLLWINGPPGFGKTILCARIVEHLSATLQTPVAHFFFSSDLESRDDPFSAVRSWISQVVSKYDDAFEYVRQEWEADSDPVATRVTSMKIFTRLLQVIPSCICVVDGLDECTSSDTGNTSVAAFLRSLADAMSGTNARILLVSRNEHRIRCALADSALESFTEHTISPKNVQLDTAAVSREIVDRKLPNKGHDVRSTLSEAMADRCDGQFLWLKMQEPSLRKGMNKKQLQQAINNSPTGLDHLYDPTWTKISQYGELDKSRAYALLRWAALALRPLTVCEITEAVLIDDSGDLPLEDLPDAVDEEYVETEIVGLCSPLLVIRSESSDSSVGQQTVCLVHFTLREYLLPNLPLPSWLRPNEHLRASHEKLQCTFLARACLQYISLGRVWNDKTLDSELPMGVTFRDYAASFWHRHINLGLQNDTVVSKLAVAFFSKSNSIWNAWRAMMESKGSLLNLGVEENDQADRLYYAVRFQLILIVVFLIKDQGCNVNLRSGVGSSVLHYACLDGAFDITMILLENGADTAVTDNNGWTPIHIASKNGHVEVVKLLLENGADAAGASNNEWTPVDLSAENGHVEIVKLLLENGADAAVADNNGWTLIHIASDNGHVEVAKLLLQKGADATVTNKDGWTPIHTASQNGHVEVVKLLLENGADAAVTNNNGWMPIHTASQNGHVEVIKLLLENRADAAVADNNGWMPIHTASQNGHVEVVKLLLENRADTAVADNNGWAPIHTASQNGHVEVIKLLLENRADAAVADNNGWMPIHTASQNGHVEVVKLLLENRADTAVADNNGWAPMHLALKNGHVEVVKLLLESGADTTIANKNGWTPIHTASQNGHVEVIKLLLENGADTAVADNNGWMPIHTASQNGHVEVVKLLLENRADTAVADNNGWAPIHTASCHSSIEVLRLLLSIPDIDVNKMDKCSRTPLFLASRYGHCAVVQLLLDDSRIAPVSTDWYGSTPLFAAVRNGHLEVAEVLLARGATNSGTEIQDGFGRTLRWWAHRSGNPKLVELLVKHADPVGNPVHEAVPVEAITVPFSPTGYWCDACTLSIPDGCNINCDGGEFDLCGECFDMGIKCPDETHTMLSSPPI